MLYSLKESGIAKSFEKKAEMSNLLKNEPKSYIF